MFEIKKQFYPTNCHTYTGPSLIEMDHEVVRCKQMKQYDKRKGPF